MAHTLSKLLDLCGRFLNLGLFTVGRRLFRLSNALGTLTLTWQIELVVTEVLRQKLRHGGEEKNVAKSSQWWWFFLLRFWRSFILSFSLFFSPCRQSITQTESEGFFFSLAPSFLHSNGDSQKSPKFEAFDTLKKKFSSSSPATFSFSFQKFSKILPPPPQ